jgi:DNA modification methylase
MTPRTCATCRVERIGDATLYLGDCSEILPFLNEADCVVSDPPWGLGQLTGGIGKERNKNAYQNYDDTEENIVTKVVPALKIAMELTGGRAIITPGIPQMWNYPKPRAVGGFYQPAAVGMGPWGFAGYNPVLFYGKDPRDGKGQNSVMIPLTQKASTNLHPCAKPMKAMMWMVTKGSLAGQTVLDPFMGSGTTGVACAKLGRKFIGIEIDETYFNIACERIQKAYDQPDMFIEPPPKPTQEKLSL